MSTTATEPKRLPIPWSKNEELNFVKFMQDKSYSNIAEGIEKYCTSKLNIHKRSTQSVSQKYYKHIKQNHEIFVIANKHGGAKNTKYVPRDKTAQFLPIEVIMKQLLDLDKNARDRILNFFK